MLEKPNLALIKIEGPQLLNTRGPKWNFWFILTLVSDAAKRICAINLMLTMRKIGGVGVPTEWSEE